MRSLRMLGAIGCAGALALAVAAPASAERTLGEIRSTSGVAVPGSYLVVLHEQTTTSAYGLAARYGGQVDHVYRSALNGFAVSMPEQAARALAADPAVSYVTENALVSVSATAQDTQPNPPNWGLDRIDQRNLPLDDSYTYPTTAANVHAYIIATGIRFSHEDFGGRAVSGYDFVDDDDDASDCNGVGTHSAGVVGGTAHGVAKEATLVGLRVLNCQGSGTYAQVIAGIDWVTENAVKPAVAHMPLGGSPNQALDDALRNSIASGISYAVPGASSGGSSCDISPGRVLEAITVGASTIDDAVHTGTGGGECLDLFAPGANIVAPWDDSDTATNTLSGRTAASAHAAGVAALLVSQNPGWTAEQVHDQLEADATAGVLTDVPVDTANLLLFVVNDDSGEPQPPRADFSATCERYWFWRYCDFDGRNSSDPDGSVTSYAWEFGDGGTGSGVTVRRWYRSAGSYPVTLTVTDNDGFTGTVTKEIQVP